MIVVAYIAIAIAIIVIRTIIQTIIARVTYILTITATRAWLISLDSKCYELSIMLTLGIGH